jgi:hypothetical protein
MGPSWPVIGWPFTFLLLFIIIFSGCAAQRGLWPPRPRSFLITHDAPQSVGLLWTSDQLVTETSTWQHTKHTTNVHALGGIRTHDRNRRAAVDLRLRPASEIKFTNKKSLCIVMSETRLPCPWIWTCIVLKCTVFELYHIRTCIQNSGLCLINWSTCSSIHSFSKVNIVGGSETGNVSGDRCSHKWC